ncbi:MAG TPA: hypothetical protein VJQ25_13795 [Nitrospira sp.]|nr:hypothetical protein [Nitrospira sp.]
MLFVATFFNRRYNSEEAGFIGVKGVVTGLIDYIQSDEECTGYAQGEAKDVQQRVRAVVKEVAEGNEKEVLYHEIKVRKSALA